MTRLYACSVCGKPSSTKRCAQHPLRKRARGNAFEPTRQRILVRDGWRCQDCGVPLTSVPHLPNSAHVGHRTARVNQGSDADSNLVAQCSRCNLRKGDNDE